MDAEDCRTTAIERQSLRGSATFGPVTASARVSVTSADDIEVEESETVKYLRLKNGDFKIRKSVFLTVDGERREVTMDALPELECQSG